MPHSAVFETRARCRALATRQRCAVPMAERRHGMDFMTSRGFDVTLALFWGTYLAAWAAGAAWWALS